MPRNVPQPEPPAGVIARPVSALQDDVVPRVCLRLRSTACALAVGLAFGLVGCGTSDGDVEHDVAPATVATPVGDEPAPPAAASTAVTPASTDRRGITVAPAATAAVPASSAASVTAATVATSAPSTVPCASELPLREQLALLVWPAVSTTDWSSATHTVEELGVGGVVLMRPDGVSADELAARLETLHAASRHGLVVATDEEGGNVQRLAAYRQLPSQRDVSSSMDPAAARQLVAEHGGFVSSLGVDMVLGPVVDVLPADGDPPLHRSRFFVGDAASVATYGAAYIEGWSAAGLMSVLKHFPGHGSASGDTHVAEGRTPDLSTMEQSDLVPFTALADRGAAVMLGHLTVPGLTGQVPASMSRAAVDLVRSTPGYDDTLVLTDALGMDAVGVDVPVAAVEAIAAGADVVLFTETWRAGEVIDALAAAVGDGTIPPERVDAAARRILRIHEPACG